jgi:hypothetical protein
MAFKALNGFIRPLRPSRLKLLFQSSLVAVRICFPHSAMLAQSQIHMYSVGVAQSRRRQPVAPCKDKSYKVCWKTKHCGRPIEGFLLLL